MSAMLPHPVCARIKSVRKTAGLTGAELAKRAKLKHANIRSYETRVIPPLPTLEKIAKALGISLVTLLDGKANKR
jgi:transcriptional regulator with XRE-family HTH domain